MKILITFLVMCFCAAVQAQTPVALDEKAILSKIETKPDTIIKIGGTVLRAKYVYAPVEKGGKLYRIITRKKMDEIAKDNAQEALIAEKMGVMCEDVITTNISAVAEKPIELKEIK